MKTPRFYLASRSTGLYLLARLGGVYHWSPTPPTGDGEGWDTAAEAIAVCDAMGNPDLRAKLAPPADVDPEPYLQATFTDENGAQVRSFAMLGPRADGEAVAFAFAECDGRTLTRFVCADGHAVKGDEFRRRVLSILAA